MIPAIKTKDIYVTFRSSDGFHLNVLENINVEAQEGEFISIAGPSGCGKTTFLRVVAGLLPATSGVTRVLGKDVRGPHSQVGIVFQGPVLLNWRTVMGNIMLQAEIRKLNIEQYRKRAIDLIELVGLKGFEKKYPFQLSGGMQQRVSICRALIHDPPLLLMDEPFGALDAMTRESMNLELQKIWMESKKTILFITHSLQEAVFLSDRIYVMSPRPGKILKCSKVELDSPRPRSLDIMGTQKFNAILKDIRELMASHGTLD